MASLSLAAKAELVLGMLLPARHRSVRLAATLAVAVVALGVAGGAARSPEVSAYLTLVVAGSLAAVAGSRLMAPGAALYAAWHAPCRWWLPAAGRLTGTAVLLVPTVVVCAAVLVGPQAEWIVVARLTAIAWLYATATAALVQAASPFLGASASGAGVLILVWTSGVPPSVWHELLQGVPFLQRPLVTGWNLLPTVWRALRGWTSGQAPDVAVLAGWVMIGALVSAWGAGWMSAATSSGQRGR